MYEFYVHLLDDIQIFILILIIVFILLYKLFKNHINSIFDPLFYFVVFTEAFCIADVIFMDYFGLIEQRYFWNYLLTETAFFIGILLFRSKATLQVKPPLKTFSFTLRTLFLFSLPLFIGLNSLVYITRGIPLLMENRLETYTIGGGWGLITRLTDILLVIILYYLLEILNLRRWRFNEWLILILIIAIQVLSGAKSAVLTIVFVVFLHSIFNRTWGNWPSRAKALLKNLTIAAIIGFLIIATVQRSDKGLADRQIPVLGQAALRFINNGDALIYAYPDRFIERIDQSNPMGAVFREYLGFLKISDTDRLPKHLGVQIAQSFIGPDADTQTNAKHNLFGYVYFGFTGSILYSFLIGTLLGFCRVRLLNLLAKNFQSGVIYILINLSVLSIASELDYFNRGLIGIIFIFIPIFLLLKALQKRRSCATMPQIKPYSEFISSVKVHRGHP